LSNEEIDSCFYGVPLHDQKYGITRITLPEMLHVAGTEIFKYMFTCSSNIIELRKSKEGKKKELDSLHQFLSSQSTRQNEKDFMRTSMRNGLTDGANIYGKERVGNLAIFLGLTYTKRRKGALESWY